MSRAVTRRRPGSPRGAPRIVVLGDLALDVVLAPARSIESGTDVPGAVRLYQGGSAANVARALARAGADATLICSVGRDAAGRALVAALRRDGVAVRVTHITGVKTARIGAVIDPSTGERSFVADRGAAECLAPGDLDPAWLRRATVLHLPAYSLLGMPLADAARAAVAMARTESAAITVDLASATPLLTRGREAAHALIAGIAPDLLFANRHEATAFLGTDNADDLLAFAPIAIVKLGGAGAVAYAASGRGGDPGDRPVEVVVATRALAPADTTGAGDAFAAGFLATWSRGRDTTNAALLRGALLAGHRVASRHLARGRRELKLRG